MKPRAAAYDRPFDQFQRYRAISRILDRLLPPLAPVLDVGGFPGDLADFLPDRPVTVLNQGVPPLSAGSVRGSGESLPFAAGAFQGVVACDVLEHVPPEGRRSFVSELARVSRGVVMVAAPFSDPAVVAAEAEVRRALSAGGVVDDFLEEHHRYGLPDRGATVAILEESCSRVVEVPNGPLAHWRPMMTLSLQVANDDMLARLFPPLMRAYNRAYEDGAAACPCYRSILVADKRGGDLASRLELRASSSEGRGIDPEAVRSVLDETRRLLGAPPPAERPILHRQVAFLTLELADRDRELARMRNVQEEAEHHARRNSAHVRAVEDQASQTATYVKHLEEALAAEKLAHHDEVARRDTQVDGRAGELIEVRREHARLEAYARSLEEHVRHLESALARAQEAARDEIRLEACKRQELQTELSATRERMEALRVHAENLAGILERVSASLPNRLLRRIRGG